MNIERMSLSSIISLLQDNRYNNTQIGKLLGVTPLQVHYYKIGKTKNPSPIIVMRLLTKFEINGFHFLADVYEDFEDLDRHYKIVVGGTSEGTRHTKRDN